MGNNVIKYGPDVLARLVAELDDPITSSITNPAPIEHGLVMDAATLIAATEWRETLAANLAVAGALCAAYLSGVNAAASWLSGQLDGQNAWEPGCGRPAPGWEP